MGCCSSKLNFYSGEIFALLNKCDENSECIGLAQLIKVGEKKVWIFKDQENKAKFKTLLSQCTVTRTTDAQRGKSLHCTAENSIPIPNF